MRSAGPAMFDWLKGRKEEKPALASFLNMTIGRAAEIDPLAFELWPEDCLIDLASTTFSIVAQGYCDLGEGAHLHRFYPDDDSAMIQIQGGDGIDDPAIDDIMIWTYLYDSHPSSDTDWKAIRDSIRQTTFRLPKGDVLYQRRWFDDSTKPEDPMTYWETVHDSLDGQESRRIFQTAMLFARELSDGQDEFLLVNMEEPEDGSRSVTYMVGRPLTQHQISA